ncbi:histidine kinase [Pedobacter sp. SD-b]|uniref:Histidine kinase n=2 Tax=Pedobacter segetis TaxID=2793069 RepID=A0ABS1BKE7_9SPHI|nr:histidine kinase [Pedobacter segetis]
MLVFAGLHFYTLYSLNTSFALALKDSVLSNLILGLLCWLISNNLSYYRPKGNKYIYVVIWCLILSALYVAIIRYVIISSFKVGFLDEKILNFSLPIRYAFCFLLIGCMTAISILFYNQQEKQELEQRKNEAEKLTKEAELSSLREKLQPHFLFNSLNSISALTLSKPTEARKMTQQLSDFLRGTLRQDDALTSLKSELAHLELYLEIEKVRFGNRLNTIIKTDEESLRKFIPPMLLQPVVENAIKFGLYDTLEAVNINIQTKFKQPNLEISISNPFDAQTAHPNKGTGFGLNSIKRRLALLFSRNDLLKTSITENQFITTILIPQTS